MEKQRRKPQQLRSRATVDVIIDAAAQILAHDGMGQFNTNRVAQKAGVSVGSLYQYFSNKNALIEAIAIRHVDASLAVVYALLDAPPDSLDEALKKLFDGSVAAHIEDSAALIRVMDLTGSPRGSQIGQRFYDKAQAALAQLFRHYDDEIEPARLERAVFLILSAADAIIHAAMVQRPEELKEGVITQDLVRMAKAFLTPPYPTGLE